MDSTELLVCQTLQAATDQNHDVVKKAEDKLHDWEVQPGFFPTLARLCTKTGLGEHVQNVNVRWMASVYLKNGVERHWRRNTRVDLTLEQKAQIREHLLQHYHAEDVPQIALQVAVVMSRIARFDCPKMWPELMPELMKQLQACEGAQTPAETQQQFRVLLVLHYVLKALASRRIMAEKIQFEELTVNIFPYMLDLWRRLTSQFFEYVNAPPEVVAPEVVLSCLERTHTVTRTLRKLVIYGFAKPYKSELCMGFIPQIFDRLRQCLELRYELLRQVNANELANAATSATSTSTLLERLERYTMKLIKIIHEFLEMHPVSFARFVSVTLEFSFHYIFHEGTALIFSPGQVLNFPNFAIHAINMIKTIMLCSTYTIRANSPSRSMEHGLGAAGSSAQADFFTNERLSYICEKIVTHYLLLTEQELQEWQQDPESFGQVDRTGDEWRFGLRPCVETFYHTCYTQHAKIMTSEVAKYIRNAQQTQLTADSDLKTILQKDAIYNAAGIAAFYFFHEIDFSAWFSQHLLAELRVDASSFRILRRRIIWLLGEWVSVKFSRELRPLAYEACLHLLRADEDMSIRLAASRTLNALIDDFDFASDSFHPYFGALFNAHFQLMSEATECDTKIAVLTNMSLIVDKMGDYAEPLSEQLIAYLPLMWRESQEYNMLRNCIVSTLEQLVKTISDIPESMRPFLYNVVEYSTDFQQPSHVYLMEDGILLWTAVVENSTALTPELLALCANLFPIVENYSENLRTIFHLIHSYIILDPQTYLSRYGTKLIEYCMSILENVGTEDMMSMLRIFETCLKTDPVYGLNLVRPTLPYIFTQVYLVKEYPMLMSYYLMMVARTLLIDQSMFMSVVQELRVENALESILDIWLDKMPLVLEMEKRKLFCLAFASIFSDNDILLSRFPVIMQTIGETLVEVMEEDSTASEEDEYDNQSEQPTKSNTPVRYHDQFVIQNQNELDISKYLSDFNFKTYHFNRCRALALKDPVHKISITIYLDWQLKSLKQQLGDARFEQLRATVYSDVWDKIQMYIKQSVDAAQEGAPDMGRKFTV